LEFVFPVVHVERRAAAAALAAVGRELGVVDWQHELPAALLHAVRVPTGDSSVNVTLRVIAVQAMCIMKSDAISKRRRNEKRVGLPIRKEREKKKKKKRERKRQVS
jgi:hypothetical protein